MITSTANERIKMVRSLSVRRKRWQQRRFVAEGLRLLEEGQGAGFRPELVLAEPKACQSDPRLGKLLAHYQASGVEVLAVAPHVLDSGSGTETAAGLVAVFPFLPPPAQLPETGLVLVLDGLRDPGNLGTILRSAWATAVAGVFCTPTTVDVYNPKAVRASMGAIFNLPIVPEAGWKEIEEHLPPQAEVWLADPHQGTPYFEVDWRKARALIIGGEAEGPSARARHLATGRVTVPMRQGVESLNAAVAASVILFETYRQRRKDLI